MSVVDAGMAMPNASVRLYSAADRVGIAFTTDEQGLVHTEGTEPDEYSVEIDVPGYYRAVTGVRLHSGCITAVIFPLTVAQEAMPVFDITASREVEQALDHECVRQVLSSSDTIVAEVTDRNGILRANVLAPRDPLVTLPAAGAAVVVRESPEDGDGVIEFVITLFGSGANRAGHVYLQRVVDELLAATLDICTAE